MNSTSSARNHAHSSQRNASCYSVRLVKRGLEHAYKLARPLIIASMSLAVTGCLTSSGSSVHVVDRAGLDVISAPATNTNFVLREANSIERICAGRMPDAILDDGVSAGMGFFGSLGTTSNQMALGGRSPSVLIIREHYYRLCELYTNLNLPPETVLSLFKESFPLVMQALQNNAAGTSSLSSRTISAPPVIERGKGKMPGQQPSAASGGGASFTPDGFNSLTPSPFNPSSDGTATAGATDQ